jgi:hypothetical protein
LIAAAIFVSGLVVGSCFTILLLKNRVIWKGPPPIPVASAVAQEISQKYGLSQEQAKRVEAIFNEEFTAIDKIRKEFESSMESRKQNLINQMRQVLSDQQFNSWLQDYNRKFMHRPHPQGPPPHGRPPEGAGMERPEHQGPPPANAPQ